MAKKHQSIQLFKNPWMEKFSHVHPITPLVVWAPIIGWFAWRSFGEHLDAWGIGALMATGLASWTLFEYVMHRFVFHFEAKSRIGKYIVYLFHGIHHEDSMDPTRLVMPPIVSLFLAIIVYSALRLILGELWVKPFFVGFLIGYLCYDYTHFAIHHFTPRTPLGRFLKQHHMTHHYVAPNSRFGVSSPIWDHVFGTSAERQQPKASQSSP